MDLIVNLKRMIKNNKRLFYISMCIKNRNNDKFVHDVINYGKDYSKIKITSCAGDENTYKPIYRISLGSSTIGFFALLRLTLNGLAYAEYYDLSPVVVFNKNVSYQEQEKIHGTENAFEYYFKQTTDLDTPTEMFLSKQKSVLECIPEHYTQIFRMYGLEEVQDYSLSEEHYKFLAKIMSKYIRLQDHVMNKLESDMSKVIDSPQVIGVHYRGTDFKNNYGSHPVSVSVDEYIDSIKGLPSQYDKYPIFLATDDSIALERFMKEFGDRVHIYEDVQRAAGKLSVICSDSERENHHFLLGYEVLRDMYTLSTCSVLVAGLSQVSIFARITKLSRNEKFEYEILIDKGINSNNRSHIIDMNKAREKKKERRNG